MGAPATSLLAAATANLRVVNFDLVSKAEVGHDENAVFMKCFLVAFQSEKVFII